jgi:hypothetical protein
MPEVSDNAAVGINEHSDLSGGNLEMIAGACNVPNALIIPFRLELSTRLHNPREEENRFGKPFREGFARTRP